MTWCWTPTRSTRSPSHLVERDPSVAGSRSFPADRLAEQIQRIRRTVLALLSNPHHFVLAFRERFKHSRIKTQAAAVMQDFQAFFDWKLLPVRTFGTECVEPICNGNDSAFNRNRIASQTPCLSGSTPSFMMARYDQSRQFQHRRTSGSHDLHTNRSVRLQPNRLFAT